VASSGGNINDRSCQQAPGRCGTRGNVQASSMDFGWICLDMYRYRSAALGL